jgi:hypothetical protein
MTEEIKETKLTKLKETQSNTNTIPKEVPIKLNKLKSNNKPNLRSNKSNNKKNNKCKKERKKPIT